eukprot:g79661.t1
MIPRKKATSDSSTGKTEADQDEDEEADENGEEEPEEEEKATEEGKEEEASGLAETASEQDVDDLHVPALARKENITVRSRTKTLENRRTPPPSPKRRKLNTSPSSKESPALTPATTATLATSSSTHQCQQTPSSQVPQTPLSTNWWLKSSWRREDDLVWRQLEQSQGRTTLARRSLAYEEPATSSSSSSSSAPILTSPSTAAATAPPAGPFMASSSSSSSSASSSSGTRTPMIAECLVTYDTSNRLQRSLTDAPSTFLPLMPIPTTSCQSVTSTQNQERKSADDSAPSPCSKPAPPVPTPDRSVRPVSGLLGRTLSTASRSPSDGSVPPIVGRNRLDTFDLTSLQMFEPGPMTSDNRARIGNLVQLKQIEFYTPRAVVNEGVPLPETYHRVRPGSRGLLLDELTHSKVMHNIKMKSAGEIKVKGKDLTIPVFAPAEHKRVRRIGESIQRQEEIAILKSKLVQTMEGAAGGSIVHLTGDAGIGKTQIMHDFEAAALTQFKDLTVCLLTADPTKTDLALGRDLLESLTGIRSQKREQTLKSSKKLDAEIKQRTKLVSKFLEKVFTKDQKEQKERLPLLNRLLSTEMAETPWSLKFTEDPTNEIRDIILQVVQGMLQQNLTVKKPNALVLLVDDAHLLDEESAVLLQGIAKLVGTGQLFLVATSRGDSCKGPGWADTLSALKAGQGYVEKAMVPLSEQEAEKMLCQYFRMDKVPPEVLQLVHSRAKGNPLFVEEVAAAMERSELASTKDSTLVLNASKMQEVDKLLPASLGSLVTKRIDSLDPAIQLLAKLASVFQDEFDGDVFRKLCAREQKRQLTEDHKKGTQRKADQIQQVRDNAMATERGLDVLKAKEILATRSCTVRVNGQPQYKQLFFFLQPEVMHQAYKMLLYSQRFLLHYQIADIIEEVDPENQELIRFHIDKALEAGGKQKDLTKEAKEKLIQKANKFKSKRIEKLVQNMEKTN